MKTKAFDQCLLGKRIREVRKNHGYTSKQAAEELNISQTYLRQIESGKNCKVPSLSIFVSICNLFHVSPDYLLQDQLEENDLSDIREIQVLYEKASCSTQRVAIAMLKAAIEQLESGNSENESVGQE